MGNKQGLTLVELLVVVGIITTLALVSIWFFRGQIFKGNDAKRKGDIHKIQLALEEYEKDHDCYPPSTLVSCNPGTGLVPYLNRVECDPATKTSYFYEPENETCPSWYRIHANLENLQDADINNPGGTFNFYTGSPNAPEAAP
jgi:prepilin-type N-terminal cleavage/methylation domain-containing protein